MLFLSNVKRCSYYYVYEKLLEIFKKLSKISPDLKETYEELIAIVKYKKIFAEIFNSPQNTFNIVNDYINQKDILIDEYTDAINELKSLILSIVNSTSFKAVLDDSTNIVNKMLDSIEITSFLFSPSVYNSLTENINNYLTNINKVLEGNYSLIDGSKLFNISTFDNLEAPEEFGSMITRLEMMAKTNSSIYKELQKQLNYEYPIGFNLINNESIVTYIYLAENAIIVKSQKKKYYPQKNFLLF